MYRRSDSPARPRRRTSYSPTPSPQHEAQKYPRRSASPHHQKPSPRATSRPSRRTPPPPHSYTSPHDERASTDEHGDSDGDAEERREEHDEEYKDDDEPPAPLPPPRTLRRQPSITMPGALFPRSPSMDPAQPVAAARRVHFPTQPTYFDYDVPAPGPSSSPERPRPPNPIPRRPRAGSVGEASWPRRIQDADEGVDADSDSDSDDAVQSGPSRKGKGKQRAERDVFLESETSSPLRPLTGAVRGEGHTGDAGLEPRGADTSGEIRVRGKERELSAVREERRAREQWWESEVETTLIREEKEEYEDKIKQLEKEVQRLRAEVRILSPVHVLHADSFFFLLFKSWRSGLHPPKNPQTTCIRIHTRCPRPLPHRHRHHQYPISFLGYRLHP